MQSIKRWGIFLMGLIIAVLFWILIFEIRDLRRIAMDNQVTQISIWQDVKTVDKHVNDIGIDITNITGSWGPKAQINEYVK